MASNGFFGLDTAVWLISLTWDNVCLIIAWPSTKITTTTQYFNLLKQVFENLFKIQYSQTFVLSDTKVSLFIWSMFFTN